MISINNSLINTIYTQHTTLSDQKQKITIQDRKAREQNNELVKKNLALEEVKHRFETMSQQLTELHRQATRLAALGEQVSLLTNMEGSAPSRENTGIGGNARDLSPMVSISLDDSRDDSKIKDPVQGQIDATRQLLDRQTKIFAILKKELEIKNELLACTPSIKPTSGVVTCKFGSRLSPFSGKREFHTGMDIANKRGTKVYATARGKVIFAKKKWLIGNLVTIDHGNNIITKYGHLNKFLVKKGDMVNRGDVIGLMGSTGKSTGPHVHYEVVVNGKPENPANYFPGKFAISKKQ